MEERARSVESTMPGEMRQLARYRTSLMMGKGRLVLTQALLHSTDRASALSALSEISAREPLGEAMNSFRLDAVLAGGPLLRDQLYPEQVDALLADEGFRSRLYEEGMISHQLYSELV